MNDESYKYITIKRIKYISLVVFLTSVFLIISLGVITGLCTVNDKGINEEVIQNLSRIFSVLIVFSAAFFTLAVIRLRIINKKNKNNR